MYPPIWILSNQPLEGFSSGFCSCCACAKETENNSSHASSLRLLRVFIGIEVKMEKRARQKSVSGFVKDFPCVGENHLPFFGEVFQIDCVADLASLGDLLYPVDSKTGEVCAYLSCHSFGKVS